MDANKIVSNILGQRPVKYDVFSKNKKPKYYQFDICPKCGKGELEGVNGPSGDYLACSNPECTFIYTME